MNTLPKIRNRPVLIVPDRDLHVSGGRESRVPARDVPVPDQAQWLGVARSHPEDLHDLMRNPHDTAILARLRGLFARNAVAVTPEDASALRIIMVRDGSARMDIVEETIPYNGVSRRDIESGVAYHQVWNPAMPGNKVLVDLLRAHAPAIAEGARILMIPPHTAIMHPYLVGVDLRRGGQGAAKTDTIDFWVPPDKQAARRDSPVAYVSRMGMQQRFSSSDLIRQIQRRADEARRRGLTPAIALDLDGTLFNAREYTWIVFSDWLNSYQGADAGLIREAVNAAAGEGHKRHIIQGWNSQDILCKALNRAGMSVDGHALALRSAREHFDSNFYCPDRCRRVPRIEGTVALVKFLQAMGLKTLFVTNRSAAEDEGAGESFNGISNGSRLYDAIEKNSGGALERSATCRALDQHGIWNAESILLRYNGPKIEWSDHDYREPMKALTVFDFSTAHADMRLVAAFDNDLAQIAYWLRTYGGEDIVVVHVEGDRRPKLEGEPIPEGAYSVRCIYDFLSCLTEWSARGKRHLSFKLHVNGSIDAHALLDGFRKIREGGAVETACLSDILSTATSFPRNNPHRVAFVAELNRELATNEALLLFENDLRRHNMRAMMQMRFGTLTYALIRGNKGIADIIRLKGGETFDISPVPPASAIRKSLDLSALSVPAPSGEDVLAGLLVSKRAGPRLLDAGGRLVYNNVNGGRYPRMEAVMGWAISAAMVHAGKTAREIRLRDYLPGIDVAPLTMAARFGVRVEWQDSPDIPGIFGDGIGRLQTQREMERLPIPFKARIHRSTLKNPDIAVWNMPPPEVDLHVDRLGSDVVDGGLLMAQTAGPVDAGDGWHKIASIEMAPGDYIFPTAAAGAAPMHFSMFQRIVR